MELERCSGCNRLTVSGQVLEAKRYREDPIYHTDFSKSLSAIISGVRDDIARTRGTLMDIAYAFPVWGSRIKDVEGLLTCGLVALHHIMSEMERIELLKNEVCDA